jgi:hypothetical protein
MNLNGGFFGKLKKSVPDPLPILTKNGSIDNPYVERFEEYKKVLLPSSTNNDSDTSTERLLENAEKRKSILNKFKGPYKETARSKENTISSFDTDAPTPVIDNSSSKPNITMAAITEKNSRENLEKVEGWDENGNKEPKPFFHIKVNPTKLTQF